MGYIFAKKKSEIYWTLRVVSVKLGVFLDNCVGMENHCQWNVSIDLFNSTIFKFRTLSELRQQNFYGRKPEYEVGLIKLDMLIFQKLKPYKVNSFF